MLIDCACLSITSIGCESVIFDTFTVNRTAQQHMLCTAPKHLFSNMDTLVGTCLLVSLAFIPTVLTLL